LFDYYCLDQSEYQFINFSISLCSSVLKLKAAGCSVDALRAAGVSFEQLRLAGFDDLEILDGKLPSDFLKSVEYDASKLLRMGLALKELVAAGVSALELRAAGFAVMELKQAGITSIQDLRSAGYDLHKLKNAFDIFELHDAGFSFEELQASGVDDKSLLDAGFGYYLESQALRQLYIETNGPLWKVRLNWCTTKPISQWYGVRVEKDLQQRERVVALDLTDNHLMGRVPEKLWLLTKLRSLHLGMNFLSGPVPPLLRNLLINNRVLTDLNTAPPASGAEGVELNPFAPKHSGLGGATATSATSAATATANGNATGTGNNYADSTMLEGGSNTLDAGRRLNFDASVTFSSPHGKFNESGHMSHSGMMSPNMTSFSPDLNSPPTLAGGYNIFNNHTIGVPGASGEGTEYDNIDRAALIELFHATNGPQWNNKQNWCSTRPLGEWRGVTVNKLGAVVKLALPSNNLQGSIPINIYYLESLKEIDLRLNQVCGPIPESLGQLRLLTCVYLQSNRLSGSIPESLGHLTHLQVLDLRCNQLTDTVPKTLSNLRQMKYLGLKSNLLKSRPIELQQMLPWCKIIT
jgi:hypothetical protein